MTSSEETLWCGGPARRNWWPWYALALALAVSAGPLFVRVGPAGLAALPLAALAASWPAVRARGDRYALTSQRVIAERGLLSRSRREVELKDIRQLTLQQTLRQRLLGVGDVEIESAGGAAVDLHLAGVAAPADVMERIRRARLSPIQN